MEKETMTRSMRFFEYKHKETGEIKEELGHLSNPLKDKDECWEVIREVPNLYGGTGAGSSARQADSSLSTKKAQHFYDNVITPMKKHNKSLI